MSILSRVNNFFVRTAGIDISESVHAMHVRIAGADENSLFAYSDGIGNVDTFEHSNSSKNTQPSTEKYPRVHRRQSRKGILKRHNVNIWDRLVYTGKDIFVDQDIAGQIRREFKLGKSATEEEYIEAAHKHIQQQLEGLSKSEIMELYNEMEQNFALDITRKNDDDRDLLMAIYSAILGEFNADSRAQMAKDLIAVSDSDSIKTTTAAKLAENAIYNMTNPDALPNKKNPKVSGNVPPQENATEYFSCVFENMTKKDVENALDKLSLKANEVEPRIKTLLAIKNRTTDEKDELQKLKILHRNIVVAGLSGANIGIMANQFVAPSDVPVLLNIANETAVTHHIDGEVNTAVIEYLQAHPEMKEKIETLRSVVLETYMEELKTSYTPKTEPEEKSLTKNNVTENKESITGEDEPGEYKQKSDKQLSVNSNGQKQVQTSSSKSTLSGAPCGGVSSVVDTEPSSRLPENKNNSNKFVKANNNFVTRNHLSEKAMQGGVREYHEYAKNNHVNVLNGYAEIINYDQADPALKRDAINQFKRLRKNDKKIVFENLNNNWQIEMSRFMQYDELALIKTFKSADSKKVVEKRCNEEQKKDKDFIRNYDKALI